MKIKTRASIDSQLGNELCTVEDTEEMFWLREADDYESAVMLGNLLVGQYRFKEAIISYKKALKIRQDDKMLYIRLAGALLTTFQFDASKEIYQKALKHGATEKDIAYSMGIWYFLKGEYISAIEWFKKCLPCDDALLMAVIYWITLCQARSNLPLDMLSEIKENMNIGHHVSYLLPLQVFNKSIAFTDAEKLMNDMDDLDFVIASYGLCGHLEYIGETEQAKDFKMKLLKRDTIWPCVSYLATINDERNKRE